MTGDGNNSVSHAHLFSALCIFAGCILLVLLWNVPCTGMSLNMNDKKTHILKKDSDGLEISVRTGDIIQIELEGTGSSGYWWHADMHDTCVRLLSEETEPSASDKTGAPELGIWRFEAVKKCMTEINMAYYRKWEGPEKASDHFLIRLNIKD